MKVIVYGSLKRGFENHNVISNSEFICETYTTKKYDMVSYGSFPAVKESVSEGFIQGELYKVDILTLSRLDSLESNGFFYLRKLVEVAHSEDLVWMYFVMNEMGAGFSKDRVDLDKSSNVQTWIF